MRKLSVRKLNRHGPNGASSPAAEGDNVSLASGFSTFNEDAELQEAYIGFVRNRTAHSLLSSHPINR